VASRFPRDVLKETLWPDADPATLANRLSVALSTVRTILDPERLFPADHFISAERDAVQIVLDHVAIDVEMFLHDVSTAEALRLRVATPRRPSTWGPRSRHTPASFLVEDVYEDWAIPLRERARSAFIVAASALAAEAEAAGDARVRSAAICGSSSATPTTKTLIFGWCGHWPPPAATATLCADTVTTAPRCARSGRTRPLSRASQPPRFKTVRRLARTMPPVNARREAACTETSATAG
jgi:hypothetical protein